MILYCIKHIPTGNLMPLLRRGRGYTHLDFHIPGHEKEFSRTSILPIPRFFESKTNAFKTLNSWLLGKWERHCGPSGMFGEEYDDWTEPPNKPPEDRKKEEFEIIKMRITQCSQSSKAQK